MMKCMSECCKTSVYSNSHLFVLSKFRWQTKEPIKIFVYHFPPIMIIGMLPSRIPIDIVETSHLVFTLRMRSLEDTIVVQGMPMHQNSRKAKYKTRHPIIYCTRFLQAAISGSIRMLTDCKIRTIFSNIFIKVTRRDHYSVMFRMHVSKTKTSWIRPAFIYQWYVIREGHRRGWNWEMILLDALRFSPEQNQTGNVNKLLIIEKRKRNYKLKYFLLTIC